MFSSKQTAQIRLFYLLPPIIRVARDQTQPGSFSRERKEPGNEVAALKAPQLYTEIARQGQEIGTSHLKILTSIPRK